MAKIFSSLFVFTDLHLLQSLKSKQESLVSSLDQITQECDKLRSQLNSIEADKDGFEKQYNAIINDLKAKDVSFFCYF
jgi:hypothetical protein